MANILYRIGKILVPFKYDHKLKEYVKKTGSTKVHYELYALMFIFSFLFSILIIYFLLPKLGFIMIVFFPVLIITIFLVFSLLVWMYYEIKLFKRKEKIEKVLPDFLGEVAVNLRAGMTFDKALWNSVEPEYDVLAKEIEIVAKKVMSGKDTEDALREFSSKYKSPILRESIDLIIVGLRSGGEISDLIERVVDTVKQASFLKKELVANIMSYVIFISMISLFIAPTLYALSYNLMLIIQDLGTKLTSSGATGMVSGLSTFGQVVISRKDFVDYSRWCIVIISVTTSLIIADLREGSIKGSIKYVFIFIGISLIVYEIMLIMFTAIFSGMVV
ncbi:type II secretion system F family protein [Candidatus Woesearchaeota archaeon]|nr:type II secretion system F family protein [Candidatus Woesearchaeota archaeon]